MRVCWHVPLVGYRRVPLWFETRSRRVRCRRVKRPGFHGDSGRFSSCEVGTSVVHKMRLLLVVVTVIAGALAACTQATTTTDPLFEIQTVSAVVATPATASVPFASPNDAAIAAALVQDPHLVDLHVTRIVGIYADDQSVDLRVKVQTDGFCHWYGVAGRVNGGVLEWRGGSALDCDGQ